MRLLQVVVFVGAVAALLAALFFVGSGTGDALWRAGIAALLADVVGIQLWPARRSDPSVSSGTL